MHQFSHAWIDFRGTRVALMRDRNSDYFENSRRAVHVHRDYAMHNTHGFSGYCENLWGLSASDGPGKVRASVGGRPRTFSGYQARGVTLGRTMERWPRRQSLRRYPLRRRSSCPRYGTF